MSYDYYPEAYEAPEIEPTSESPTSPGSTQNAGENLNLDKALQNAFTTVNVFILILIMIAMGAKMKLKHIREHIQKPLGPLSGFISQFVIMPLVAFIVAHALSMKAEHAIGALIMACSPGGVMSNMVTYYTNGDCSLSITMTTLSTLMAFGMMPANLWLYTRSWTSGSTLSIPYTSILVSLLLILIPVIVGYMFVMKYPNMRGVVAQTGSFSGMLAIIISMVLFFFMNFNLMLVSAIDIWIATAAMPVLGFILGYLLSASFCLTAKQKRTVGFETGCQNASIAFSVISMSFPADVLGSVLLVPLLFCLFSFIEGWVFVIVWQMGKSIMYKVDEWKEEGWACVDWEESSESDEDDEEEAKGENKHHNALSNDKLSIFTHPFRKGSLQLAGERKQSPGGNGSVGSYLASEWKLRRPPTAGAGGSLGRESRSMPAVNTPMTRGVSPNRKPVYGAPAAVPIGPGSIQIPGCHFTVQEPPFGVTDV